MRTKKSILIAGRPEKMRTRLDQKAGASSSVIGKKKPQTQKKVVKFANTVQEVSSNAHEGKQTLKINKKMPKLKSVKSKLPNDVESSHDGDDSEDKVKPKDEKAKAINKMLKSLDIKISGFDNIIPPEEKIIVDLKSSISENVKTKSRTAAAKTPGSVGKASKKELQPREKQDCGKANNKSTATNKCIKFKAIPKNGEKQTQSKEMTSGEPKTALDTKSNMQGETTSSSVPTESTSIESVDKTQIKGKKKASLKAKEKKPVAPRKIAQKRVKPIKKDSKSKLKSLKNQKVEEEIKVKNKLENDGQDDENSKNTEESDTEKKNSEKRETKSNEVEIANIELGKEQKGLDEKVSEEKCPATIEKNAKEKETPNMKKIKIVNRKKIEDKPPAKKNGKKAMKEAEAKNKGNAQKAGKPIKPSKTKTGQCNQDNKLITKPEEAKVGGNDNEDRETADNPKQTSKSTGNKDRLVGKKTRFDTVRKRLQKKYKVTPLQVQNKLKKSRSKKSAATELATENDVIDVVEKCAELPVKRNDIYDFKSGSESEGNIKMDLPILKNLRDFSDDDDKPLLITKEKLKSEKMAENEHEEKKIEEVKIKSEFKQPPKQVRKPVTKPKVEVAEFSEASSESSDEEIYLGPKRHRMASLNALAKVQCLYENESRTAHELGLSKTVQITPKIRTLNSSSESDDEKLSDKIKPTVKKEGVAKKEQNKSQSKDEQFPKEEEKDDENVVEEEVVEVKRELRNAPGMRGAGKHWEFNDESSFESAHESEAEEKKKVKKRKISKVKPGGSKTNEKEKNKDKVDASKKKKKKIVKNCDGDEVKLEKKKTVNKKRKKEKKEDNANQYKGILARKRMASLNASAIVAATYEVERHLDRNLASDCSSFDSHGEDDKGGLSKKTKDIITVAVPEVTIGTAAKEELKSEPKDSKDNTSRPTSSSVVIVQDTDVTITGVYVNATTGSSQEAYCKMQYRVQSSVTEERVVRPNSVEPPKSYTPLSALSSMRPPGAATGDNHPPLDPMHLNNPNSYQSAVQEESQPYHYPIHQIPPTVPPSHRQPPDDHSHHYNYSNQPGHHFYPQQPTPMTQGSCDAYADYHPNPAQSALSTTSISGGSGSSAFCAPNIQQGHHDMTGYYQPAGPLISPHALPSSGAQSTSNPTVPPAVGITKKQLSESDPEQLQQAPQSSSAAESSDSDVLITGGDLAFRYPSAPQQTLQPATQQQGQHQLHQQQQNSPYPRPMHQMHYSPAYPPNYYSPYPGEAMCYSPPYQPYFPTKVYQSAPTYRRYPSYYQPGPPASDLYDTQPQNSPAPPPSSGSQIIPTGPTGHSQHLDHYPGPPGFYPGYSPGGGQCYSRSMQPAYMEYPPPCPCPMPQSCPKNALTGPLIGSNSSNGCSSKINGSSTSTNTSNINDNIVAPLSSSTNSNTTSMSIASSSSKNSSMLTSIGSGLSTSSSLSNNQQLNTVRGPVKNQSHEIDEHCENSGSEICDKPPRHLHECKIEVMEPVKSEMKFEETDNKTNQYEENVVVPPVSSPINYTINTNVVESQEVLSSEEALSKAPEQTENPTEDQSKDQSAAIPEKVITAIGQTVTPACRKARLGKTMARERMYGSALHPPIPPQLAIIPQSTESISAEESTNPLEMKNEIKSEHDDFVVILCGEKQHNIKNEPEIHDAVENSSPKTSKEERPEHFSHRTSCVGKRIKILESNKSQNKKSSTNGYKSLIKQTVPKSYLCLSRRKRNSKDRYGRGGKSKGIRKRKLVLTEQQKKRLKLRKKNLIALKRSEVIAKEAVQEDEMKQSKLETKSSASLLETTIDLVARGYFSEPEIRSFSTCTSTGRRLKKTKVTEPRSKSETKKPSHNDIKFESHLTKQQESTSETTHNDVVRHVKKKRAKHTTKPGEKRRVKREFKLKKMQSSDCDNLETSPLPHMPTENDSTHAATSPTMAFTEIKVDTGSRSVDLETASNNNNFLETNNNDKLTPTVNEPASTTHPPTEFVFLKPEIPAIHQRRLGQSKRGRSRSRFGNRKRLKGKHTVRFEIDETFIPRRADLVPKWNNGWRWEGQPYKGAVFLNSDDPLVVRTCYPAMRHSEGDIIRPRDCVLLRADTKKDELPYVAKVASLWENSEDGEMMMSLLWYYRPEHTEQGRQTNDGPDEVFASKHRDHNSVACIEDKCYVLTFSEYCRYRKDVRALEEGVVEKAKPIVPKLPNYNRHRNRKVPPNTNPELVMFCQRVYEFRLKRLVKTPCY